MARAGDAAAAGLVLLLLAWLGVGLSHPLAPAVEALDAAARVLLLRTTPLARLADLAAATDADGRTAITRPYLSPAHARAAALLARWMRDAGLGDVWIDGVGNVRGRAGGTPPTTSTLLLGSHFDSVPDAGRFDGCLGLVAALAAVEASKTAAAALGTPWPPPGKAVEVVAFADEEGSRFGTTFLGSAALAGTLAGSGALDTAVDAGGVSLGEAIAAAAAERAAGGVLAGVPAPAWDGVAAAPPASRRAAVAAAVAAAALGASNASYVEAHMEQGPVLERLHARAAAVSAIAAQARFTVEVVGTAGHAGTVPMRDRADAGAAAAEAVSAIERVCRQAGRARDWARPVRAAAAALVERTHAHRLAAWLAAAALVPPPPSPALVCTVGTMTFRPGAPNVIPGSAAFSVDVRDSTDAGRDGAAAAARAAVAALCARRRVACTWTRTHASSAVAADERLTRLVEGGAAAAAGLMAEVGGGEGGPAGPPAAPLARRRLVSGAGHDAAALAAGRIPWAMVFVRDRGGVSHTPLEDVRDGDVGAAGAVVWGALEGWLHG